VAGSVTGCCSAPRNGPHGRNPPPGRGQGWVRARRAHNGPFFVIPDLIQDPPSPVTGAERASPAFAHTGFEEGKRQRPIARRYEAERSANAGEADGVRGSCSLRPLSDSRVRLAKENDAAERRRSSTRKERSNARPLEDLEAADAAAATIGASGQVCFGPRAKDKSLEDSWWGIDDIESFSWVYTTPRSPTFLVVRWAPDKW
jgi:hypothetical protein